MFVLADHSKVIDIATIGKNTAYVGFSPLLLDAPRDLMLRFVEVRGLNGFELFISFVLSSVRLRFRKSRHELLLVTLCKLDL